VYAPPDFSDNLGQLYFTHNGGRTWALAPLEPDQAAHLIGRAAW
jgi:hypothetical protein